MRSYHLPRLFLSAAVGIVGLLLAACNLPQATPSPSPSNVGGNVGTLVALTLQAAETATAAAPAPPSPLPPTVPPAPTFTPSPTLTPTLTLTPTVTLTPTPSTPHISVSVNTNCRTGPGDAYDRVGGLLVGQTAEVLARDPSGQFWYIPNPQRPGQSCWVWGQYATITGDTSSLPLFTPPPTPTPVPAFVLKRITAMSCNGILTFFIEISNTGQVVWESVHLDVYDLTNSVHSGGSANIFDDRAACSHQLIANIPPGGGGYIGFLDTRLQASHHIRFTVTLYTKDGQSGEHVTRTIEYRP